MEFLVTCGPTFEPLDEIRRLTNFSTGKLGADLANHLTARGHSVTLLRGTSSTYTGRCSGEVIEFTTTSNLLGCLRELAAERKYNALFHAAAVADFTFGKVYRRSSTGELEPISSGKFGTRDGSLLVELAPTVKVIAELRTLFPSARLFGWKYEIEGTRETALALGMRQINECRTDFCVVNGAAYGPGFGLTSSGGLVEHCPTAAALYESLERHATAR